jgi:hypothetical protein
MEIQTRHDLFEPGDLTSLICVDDPQVQRAAVDQVSALNYKIHTGLFTEDISLKLKAHSYEMVVVYENFNDTVAEGNPVLAEVRRIPTSQRRAQFIVLIGPNMITNDEMQAFQYSVDLTFGVSDLANLAPVLRRGVARYKDFYRLFNECLRMSGG